jgi:glucosamine--fructose-6-phosphate aminotransferase (isomerizing)
MCGIVGIWIEGGSVLEPIIEGLRTLEYRGYDSSGVGLVGTDGIVVRRKKGRLSELEHALNGAGATQGGSIGIGHTRWATHGEPSDANAHPHVDAAGRLALVHNGIIENYLELRHELAVAGIELTSQTDTEVLAKVIGRELDGGCEALEAVRRTLARVRGNYAIALVTREPDPHLICARHGPPLCVSATAEGVFLASDVIALLPHSRDVQYLEDGDIAELTPGGVRIVRIDGSAVDRPVKHIEWDAESASKAGFPHFMLKEIHEQPDVIAAAFAERIDLDRGDVVLEGACFSDEALRKVERVQITACGTALHAGWIAGYMIEALARVPVDVDYASEFRYRNPVVSPNTYVLGISQSGETADTLEALRLARELGAFPICIVNAIGSSMVRECGGVVPIRAGPEIGVASTKAFVAMLVAAYLIAVRMGRARGTIDAERGAQLLGDLLALPGLMRIAISEATVDHVREIAERYHDSKGFLFLGRGINYPVALEGALKLKEISYVHAEGYPAGEMKHGPIALIEPGMTTLAIATDGVLAEKVRSNIEQVRARGGQVVCVGHDPGSRAISDAEIEVPATNEWLSPILEVVPLQLLAYFIAYIKGCDIDKPRNLAKSVTVE